MEIDSLCPTIRELRLHLLSWGKWYEVKKISKKKQIKEKIKKKDYIEGDFEDIEEEDDRKL